MGRWGWGRAEHEKACGPQPPRFWLGLGPGPMAHDADPMSYGLVISPGALSCILWPCPMSHGPILCTMALSYVPCPKFK